MNNSIQSRLAKIQLDCKLLEKSGLGVKDDKQKLCDHLSFCMFKFLAYLASASGRTTLAQTKYINDCMNGKLTSAQVDYFAKSLSSSNVCDSMRKLFAVFARGDMDGVTKLGSKNLLSFFDELGKEFIALDFNEEDIEIAYLYIVIFHMSQFLEGYCINYSVPSNSIQKNTDNLTQKIADSEPVEPEEKEQSLEELMEKLGDLVGLSGVKQDIEGLTNLLKVRQRRKEEGLSIPSVSMHMVFTGNPGTGKTTVARLVAKIYKQLGVVSQGQLVEVDRSGLVSGYVGQTALKTKEVCDKAKGGVLFIDEAYTLTSSEGKNDFGIEAVNTLLKYMEDYRDDFVVIVAGYTKEMEDFLDSNPGLKSRFGKVIEFADYSADELMKILEFNCDKNDLEMTEEAKETSKKFFEKRIEEKTKNFANARDVRNYVDRILTNQANRLSHYEEISKKDLVTVEKEDVENIVI